MISMASLSEIPEKNKTLIAAIILIFVLILDFVFLMKPQIRILSKLSSKASLLGKDLKNAKKDIASQKEFENQLTVLKASIKNFGSTVIPEEELPSILEKISLTAKQTYVKIIQIKPLKEEKTAILKAEGGVYYRIPILIDIQCGYHVLGKFLNELESSSAFLKIIGLEISANPADSLHHLARLTVQTIVLGK